MLFCNFWEWSTRKPHKGRASRLKLYAIYLLFCSNFMWIFKMLMMQLMFFVNLEMYGLGNTNSNETHSWRWWRFIVWGGGSDCGSHCERFHQRLGCHWGPVASCSLFRSWLGNWKWRSNFVHWPTLHSQGEFLKLFRYFCFSLNKFFGGVPKFPKKLVNGFSFLSMQLLERISVSSVITTLVSNTHDKKMI